MSSQGIMSSKKANHNPIIGEILVFAPRLGPKINSLACLWVLPRPCHLSQCWLPNQRLIFLLIFCLETPKYSSGPTNFWTEPSLVSLSTISYPCNVPQRVQGPNTAPQYAGWRYHSTPFGAVVPVEMLFWGLEDFQSHQAVRTNTQIHLCSNIQLNFISTSQDSIYLSLKNCNIPS